MIIHEDDTCTVTRTEGPGWVSDRTEWKPGHEPVAPAIPGVDPALVAAARHAVEALSPTGPTRRAVELLCDAICPTTQETTP